MEGVDVMNGVSLNSKDIWQIVNDELRSFEDISVVKAWLNLTSDDTMSHADVYYYDLSSLVDDPFEDNLQIMRFDIPHKAKANIIKKIHDLTNVPPFESLKVLLDPEVAPVFHIDMTPVKKG